ncbi:MAG TPA: hypothetical protein VN848_01630 [Gemmatimonadales bacterium]|nr:hypothetical protein [Gemmatimonadales bacterium]
MVEVTGLGGAIQRARDKAKEILSALERAGHPQTGGSSSLYLSIVAIQKRIRVSTGVPRDQTVIADLEQLAKLCEGKLAPVKPLLEEAARSARQIR